jgi:hypothetical protein
MIAKACKNGFLDYKSAAPTELMPAKRTEYLATDEHRLHRYQNLAGEVIDSFS